jgi:hypothetical protein
MRDPVTTMSSLTVEAATLSVFGVSWANAGIADRPVVNAKAATLVRCKMRMLFTSRLPITASEHRSPFFYKRGQIGMNCKRKSIVSPYGSHGLPAL